MIQSVGIPLPVQLPVDVAAKRAEQGPNTWAPITNVRDTDESNLLAI